MSEPKNIVLVVGPSGAGKTTLMEKAFLQKQLLRSVTSRSPRPNEVDGVDYIFKSKNEIENMIKNNRMVQYVEYNGNYYGISKDEIEEKMNEYTSVTAAVVYETIQQFTDYVATLPKGYAKVIPVFTSIDKEHLLKHFEQRTESEEEKEKRISLYEKEILNEQYFPKSNIINMNQDDDCVTSARELLSLVYSTNGSHKRMH